MLKILILSHNFNPDVGGIETNSELLAEAFQNLGATVHVLTWTKKMAQKQFPFTVIRNPGIVTIFQEHRWADVILENNPCLRLSWPNIVIRKPLVIALNTWVSRIKGYKGTRDRLKLLWLKRAVSVIAVSDALRREEWPTAAVIQNPYNDQLFKIMPGIDKTIPFVFLGRLVSDKGADLAIQAVNTLIQAGLLNGDANQLTIIGDGPEKEKLHQLVRKNGLEKNVHFTGILTGEALVTMLNRHRFILVPSSWEEPYGNVVLEAMACGCIPVASDGGGLPEAVGDAGLLFKRNNPDDLVRVIRSTLSDEPKIDCLHNKAVRHLQQHVIGQVAAAYFQKLKDAAETFS